MSADIVARALAQNFRTQLAAAGSDEGAALVATPTGSSVQTAIEGFPNRPALKALVAYDGARAYLREAGRAGTFVYRTGSFASQIAADPQEGVYLAPDGTPTVAGVWVRQVDGHFNARWWGAKGDAATDDSTAIQAAINAVSGFGGGTLRFPPGNYRCQNIRLRPYVVIEGAGACGDGFSGSLGATVFQMPSSPTMDGLCNLALGAGGSGYTSAPTVSFTGGGGSGAAGVAILAAGVVVDVVVTDPGYGYTSAPAVVLTGGGGSGATATAEVAARVFYTTTETSGVTTAQLSGFTLRGPGIAAINTQGVHIHAAYGVNISNINIYRFSLEGLRWDSGAGGLISGIYVFACARIGTIGYRTGALRLGGTDMRLSDVEVGADYGDASALCNAGIYLYRSSASVLATNVIAQGGDAGWIIEGQQHRLVNCRADFSYGHGFWLSRGNIGWTPPWKNSLISCWAHRNGRWATNTYDNYRIEAGHQIAGVKLIGCYSGTNAVDTWKARYGLWNGAFDTDTIGFRSDGGELSGRYFNGSGSTGTPGPLQSGCLYTFVAVANSLTVTNLRAIRITNAGGALSVSDLLGGQHDDELEIHSSATNVTLTHGGTGTNKMYLAGQQSRLLTQYAVVHLRNMGGTWYEVQPWTKQAAITALAVAATTGTLPTADGAVIIANATAPTLTELLEYCREQDAKINALRVAMTACGLTA